MSADARFPSLFGRFTVVLRDHDHLRSTLSRLLELCSALEQGVDVLPDALMPAHLMRDLEHELSQHFAAEESSAYFGAVEAEEPRLAEQVRELRREHAKMLSTTVALVQFAAIPACWPFLVAPMRALILRFEAHEHSEARLMNQLFRPRQRAN